MRQDHPPFGGSLQLYKTLFSPHFSIKVMEECNNSIPPRLGNELFIILKNKDIS
jgi:thiopurine S-methyltransferase